MTVQNNNYDAYIRPPEPGGTLKADIKKPDGVIKPASKLCRAPQYDTFERQKPVENNKEPLNRLSKLLTAAALIGGGTLFAIKGKNNLGKLGNEVVSAVSGTKPLQTPGEIINRLVSNLSDAEKLQFEANPMLRKFYESLDSASLERLTPKNISEDLKPSSFLKGLSVDFSKPLSAYSEDSSNVAAVIARRNAYLSESSNEIFTSAIKGSDTVCQMRAKGAVSSLNKLNSKIENGAVVDSFDAANALIADGIGTRAIFKPLTASEALDALKKAGISDDEIVSLKTLWQKTDYTGLSTDETALIRRANKVLAERQTSDFVDKLARALENNEITMSELNNYAGKNSIAYLSEEQISKIRSAWEKSDYAKNGGTFTVVSDINPDSQLAHSLGFDREYLQKLSEKSQKASGYTATQSNFIYSNGTFGEGQFRGPEVQAFAEFEHFPYDIRKGKTTVQKIIDSMRAEGKTEAASQLSEYQTLVRRISKDKAVYDEYNDYLSRVYSYLRKKELGIIDITGNFIEPKLQIKTLTPYENELLSKECLQNLAAKRPYAFVSKKAA